MAFITTEVLSMKLTKKKKILLLFGGIIMIAVILLGHFSYSRYIQKKKQHEKIIRQAEIKRENAEKKAKEEIQKEKISLKPWYTYHGIAHALGGLNEKNYLNSIDGFYSNYNNGYRIFEMDLRLTTDNIPVGRHKWGPNLSDPLSKGGYAVSYHTFKQIPLYGRYTPTAFLDILNLMQKYPDFYLMTDTKGSKTTTVKKQFTALVHIAKRAGKEKYLDRIIVQIYNDKMYDTVKSVYPFKHFLYTTYKQHKETYYHILKFCKKNKIEAITSPEADINDYRMALVRKFGLYSYTHTINDSYNTKELMKLGTYGVYSDFVTPSNINKAYLEVNCPKFALQYMRTVIPGMND